jgi:hypothetical protein
MAALPNDVTIRRTVRDFGCIMVTTTNNKYVFTGLFGDEIHGGDKADIEGLFAYTGESSGNNYVSESDIDAVPDVVIDAASQYGSIVEDVDGGWASWDGRPEFSTSYVDITDTTVVQAKQ